MEGSFPVSQRGPSRLSRTFVVVTGVAIAIALALAIVLIMLPRLTAGGTTQAVVGDHRYDAVEESRLGFGLGAPAADHRYDEIERIRAERGN